LAEEHLVASTVEGIIKLFKENESYFNPEIDCDQHYPSEAFSESDLLDDPDYLPPPDNPDLQPEISWRLEIDPSTCPACNNADSTPQLPSTAFFSRGINRYNSPYRNATETARPISTCAEHLSSLLSAFTTEPVVATMSDASPSKRRKTKGTPMKTKKSFGKQVAPC
jgi:hypothetical protein